MRVLLRLMSAVCLAWAVLLLGLKDRIIPPAELTALGRAFADSLGISNLILVPVFWHAGGNPSGNRAIVYTAIAFAALKTANDLYGLLVLLPPDQALIALADLVLSVGLLVGILEALPRMTVPSRTDQR